MAPRRDKWRLHCANQKKTKERSEGKGVPIQYQFVFKNEVLLSRRIMVPEQIL